MILLHEKIKEEMKRLFNVKIKDSSIKEIKELISKEINQIILKKISEEKNKSISEILKKIDEELNIIYVNSSIKLYKDNNIRSINDEIILLFKDKIIKEKFLSQSEDFNTLSIKKINNYIVANEIKKIIIDDLNTQEQNFKNILKPLYNICSIYIPDNDKINDINVEILKKPFYDIGLQIMLYTNNVKFYIKKSKKIEEFLKNPNYDLIKEEDIYQICLKLIKEIDKDLLYLAEPNKEIINDFFDKIENIYKNYKGVE